MFTKGEYRDSNGTYGVLMKHTSEETEILLIVSNTIESAFKHTLEADYSFLNTKAKEMYAIVKAAIAGCKPKVGNIMPFLLGSSMYYEFTKANVSYLVETHNSEIVGMDVTTENDDYYLSLKYLAEDSARSMFPQNIPYVKLTRAIKKISEDIVGDIDANEVQVRSVDEIRLEKDLTCFNNKKYYIVNDDAVAEQIFSALDNYNGVIAYDTETSGLRINCFGKINSKYQRDLIKYNEEHPDDKLRADRLVGIIFCVESDVSYYFPCFNRKFKNLYEEDTPTRRAVIDRIKVKYTIGELGNRQSEMADYIRNTPSSEWTPDIILMERVRHILETRHIAAHNGSFEWRVGWQYEIDTNLKDDTMILHQIMYKFRSTTSNRGEPSNLKYLARVELGLNQLELGDFFPEFKEDEGEVRNKAGGKKKKGSKIDFSYMDYEGTRLYAPTDGDVTYQLLLKYKLDLIKNHKEQEYIYNVEVLVSCAIAYMEFYGHRIDEAKIMAVRDQTKAEIACIESEIRQIIEYANQEELDAYANLKQKMKEYAEADESGDKEKRIKANEETVKAVERLRGAIDKNEEKAINLDSPSQVAELFYDILQIPLPGDKRSVAKKVIQPLVKAKNSDESAKYPAVRLYSQYKSKWTLVTKFFDNLPYFMYPGGYIFSSYGQISTATGRMSCRLPNAQQYPKSVTNIVIPRDGYVMMDADYSQIEYRVLVALSGEEHLAKVFEDPDSDYHTLMASLMYSVPYASVTSQMRSDAKSFNFGIPYGMGFRSLAILLRGNATDSSVDEAKEKYELYFKDQPKTRKFFDQVKEMAQVNRYTKTFWSRYRYYSFEDKDGNVDNAKKASALRQAGNAVIQGCIYSGARVQTKEYGIVKIEDIVDKHLQVWDGEKWSAGDILYSGKKRKCIVTFSTGQQFICSPIHKFLVKSARGNERFVECQDLRGSNISPNPHRVVINRSYTPSDWKYSSKWAHKYRSVVSNGNNIFVENIGDSFKAGVVLGRLASDGSIFNREVGGSHIRQIIAEHEFEIIPKLKEYMQNLGYIYRENELREGRNERINHIDVYSKSLVNEICDLDIKNQIPPEIFQDTEMLRGFLRGIFDGDGGISGKTITLTFGTQADFEPMCRQIQKALLFFGIRSRYHEYMDRYKIVIKTNDNQKFLDVIGFISEGKQQAGRDLECIRDEHIFGQALVVQSVEITDEYIDMYDVCNTDGGYYVADGIITHNTAADIFKISVARNFMYIRENNLLGKLLIVNMIHDEQLFEVDAQVLNVQRVLRDIGKNMQFKVEGFPPLYIGAGVGPAWAKAKDKMAEIHPVLLDQLSAEADNTPLYREDPSIPVNPKDILEYFDMRVLEFRRDKVKKYLLDPSNHGKDMHPAIGNLLNLQFNYGHSKEEGLTDDELTMMCIDEFIKHNGIEGITSADFKAAKLVVDKEDEVEYEDDEDEEFLSGGSEDISNSYFSVVDESNVMYGSSVHDLIKVFGSFVSPERKICGINTLEMGYKKKDELVDFLCDHICEPETTGAMEVIFLQEGNILNRTGLYVSGITGSEVDTRIKLMTAVKT